jgi:arylsulfatase A-like enzyme
VLLVMADEWRAQALGYAGDPNAHTPTIDRFARESVNFEQAVAGCSVCCPARASLVTGQYPLTNGVYINDVELQPKDVTLGEAFRNAGYRTGYIGKWHLYGSPDGRYGRRESYIPPASRFGFDYWKAAECTHDYNHSLYYEGNDQNRKYWPGYDALAQTDDACRYLREHANSSAPFFLMLSWGPPHFPLHTAPEQYQAKYRDREIKLRANVPDNSKNTAIAELRGYYAHIAALDDCFKQLLDAVEATGVADDTIVVFTSDHGDMMQSQGLSYKLYPWEESIRIPLLIRYPRKHGRSGRRSAALVNSPDLMPTLLGMSGIPIPARVQGTDYSSSTPASRASMPHSSAFLSLPVPIGEALRYGFAEYRGVRDQRYTYARSINGPWLLYDNRRDPFQLRNLCGRPEARDIQAGMDRELNAWLQASGDQFLPARAYLERDRLTHFVETQFPVGLVRSPWGDWRSTLSKPAGRPSDIAALGELLDDPAARSVVTKELPDLTKRAVTNERLRSLSLRLIQQLGLGQITDAQLQSIDSQLAGLPR